MANSSKNSPIIGFNSSYAIDSTAINNNLTGTNGIAFKVDGSTTSITYDGVTEDYGDSSYLLPR